MRKILSLLFVAFALVAHGRRISPTEAASIAADFFKAAPTNAAAKGVTRVKSQDASPSTPAPYYVFNASEDTGFVIISGDDRAPRILGYSFSGSFDFKKLPPQLASILDRYAEQIVFIPEGQLAHPTWSAPSDNTDSADGILLPTANWGQDYPYNTLTPVIDGKNCPTGCVATAMAIIMKYHNWPPQPRNKWAYSYGGMNHEVDFSQSNYNFADFKDAYDKDEPLSDAVNNLAKMMYDCGVAAVMQYSPTESGAMTEILGHVMMRYFKYSPECQHLHKKFFSDEAWFNLLNDNLSKGYPVIYGASSENLGHEFVIDGVKGNMFHINWGWDGLLNGYYSLDGLTPDPYVFSDSHHMVVNIIPDKSEKEYAEIWSNVGLFSDATMAPIDGEDDGHGMEIGCENIYPGTPFDVITQYLSGPMNFVGEVALAVVNENNEIVEILKKIHLDENLNGVYFPETFYPYVNQTEAHYWKDVIYDGEISDNYRLQLFAKRDNESEWLLVTNTIQSPSSLPLIGNKATVVKENITYHCADDERADISFMTHIIRLGQNLSPNLMCRNGVAHLYVDGKYVGTASDYTTVGTAYYPQSVNVDIDIVYSRYENLQSKSIDVPEPGKLSELLEPSDLLNLFELKLSGEINDSDIETINGLTSLGVLDLRNSKLVDNKLEEPLKFLQILYLPSGLTHLESNITHQALIVDIPESVINCGRFTGTEFIKLNSKTPPSFADDFTPQLKYTVLFVPTGAKETYSADPIWGSAREIIENDEPMNATWNFPYLNITDSFCALSNGYRYIDAGLISYPPVPWDDDPVYPGRYFVIPAEVSHRGVTRQVSFIKDMRPRVIFTSNGEIPFQGRDIYFLPEDGFLKGTCSSDYNGTYPTQYAVTPRLTANFTGFGGHFLVPAYSQIGSGDKLDDLNEIYERIEMFTLEKDSSSSLIALTPALKGTNIQDVLVNGNSIQPCEQLASGQLIYNVDFSKEVTLAVTYDYHGLHTLTTNYPNDVLAEIPDTKLTLAIKNIEEDILDNDSEFDVYTLTGICLLKSADKSRLTTLSPGIYLLRRGATTQKLLIP